jgi:nitrogen fixation NifU-like protein
MPAMKAMLTSRGQVPGDEDVIGDGVALSGVSRYPARVKCALLGWAAFTDALARAGVDIAATSTDQPVTAAQAPSPTPRAQELT